MAIQQFPMTVTVRDGRNLRAKKQFIIGVNDAGIEGDIESQMALAISFAGVLLTALDNLIDGVIESANVALPVLGAATGLKTLPGGQDIATGATFKFYINPDKTYPMFIPSVKNAVYLSNLQQIDTADPEVVAFVQALDIDVNGVRLVISDGEQVDPALGASGLQEGYYTTKARTAD